ncbi:MAG: hypothetical protein GY865_19910 [candidate division Zixibacteria bacterium]|nr:hypothetical protein [candidate division Zixibacteria bacterium]
MPDSDTLLSYLSSNIENNQSITDDVIGRESNMENYIPQNSKKKHNILTDSEMDFFLNTSVAWETIRSQISDTESLEKLIEQIHIALNSNEDINQLKARLERFGTKVMSVAKKVYFISGE